MKYKAQIIGLLALFAVFGVMFAVWQFHFKEIFNGYKEDDRLREALEKTLSQLKEDFQGYKPELLIEEWQNSIQPWRNAREERARYFNFGDWYEIDVVPPEERMLKFWYTEESNKMIYDLYMKVYERMGGYDRFPTDLPDKLNIAKEADWAGKNVAWPEVERNLKQLGFGIKLSTLLIQSNVSRVRDISIWQRRFPENYGGMLGLQTVGLQVGIASKDLVKLLENISQEPRYFTVDAIRISYPYIAYPTEPELQVEFLLTQANYRAPEDPKDPALTEQGAAGAGAAPAVVRPRSEEAERRARSREVPQGALGKFWRWFKQTVLYMPA